MTISSGYSWFLANCAGAGSRGIDTDVWTIFKGDVTRHRLN
jgi:hypothetical protein